MGAGTRFECALYVQVRQLAKGANDKLVQVPRHLLETRPRRVRNDKQIVELHRHIDNREFCVLRSLSF